MGKEFKVSSLDEMCALMCDNVIPQTEHLYCLRCGRKLKSEEAKIKGFGKVCERKAQKESKLSLF